MVFCLTVCAINRVGKMVAIPPLHYHWRSFRANPFSGYVLMHLTVCIGPFVIRVLKHLCAQSQLTLTFFWH